jgi:hypothetical protein
MAKAAVQPASVANIGVPRRSPITAGREVNSPEGIANKRPYKIIKANAAISEDTTKEKSVSTLSRGDLTIESTMTPMMENTIVEQRIPINGKNIVFVN